VTLPAETPPPVAYTDAELRMSGLQSVREWKDIAFGLPLGRLTGMRLTDAGPGTACMALPITGWYLTSSGLPSGSMATLAALAAHWLAMVTTLEHIGPYTITEHNMSYLRPPSIDAGLLMARARVVYTGRQQGFSEASIEDDRGRVVAHSTCRGRLPEPDAAMPRMSDADAARARRRRDRIESHLRPVEGRAVPQTVWDVTTGLDVVRQIAAGTLDAAPVTHMWEIRLADVEEDSAVCVMPASPWCEGPIAGVVSGQPLTVLAETAAIYAVITTLAPRTAAHGLGIATHYLRPAATDGRDLVARARVVHRGRTLAVATAEVENADGRTIALTTQPFSILEGEPWVRPTEQPVSDRRLATVLFTDVVGSTRIASERGDATWRELLEEHNRRVRSAISRLGGHEVNQTGDGFVASFDSPDRAVECAVTIREDVRALGIRVRAGIHTGECEVRDGELGGVALHIASRVMQEAGPGEVLVSSTVKDLTVGSPREFHARGIRTLKGVPGRWRLYSVG
jgi:uncharacterized protein (TIGR00369 family)